MNTRLGNGKVHATYRNVSKLPLCGGNKAAERYTDTNLPVDCTKCLKELAKQAEADERNAYYAGVAEQNDQFGSQAEFSADLVDESAPDHMVQSSANDGATWQPFASRKTRKGAESIAARMNRESLSGVIYRAVPMDPSRLSDALKRQPVTEAQAETTDADVRAKVIELAGSKDATMAEFKQALYLLSPSELREWFGVTAEDLSTGFTGRELMDFRVWVASLALPATAPIEAVGKLVEAVETAEVDDTGADGTAYPSIGEATGAAMAHNARMAAELHRARKAEAEVDDTEYAQDRAKVLRWRAYAADYRARGRQDAAESMDSQADRLEARLDARHAVRGEDAAEAELRKAREVLTVRLARVNGKLAQIEAAKLAKYGVVGQHVDTDGKSWPVVEARGRRYVVGTRVPGLFGGTDYVPYREIENGKVVGSICHGYADSVPGSSARTVWNTRYAMDNAASH